LTIKAASCRSCERSGDGKLTRRRAAEVRDNR
jgi:hypothetical protein